MVRELTARDKVQSKHDSHTMEIIKYVTQLQLGVGNVYSDHDVECVRYDNGARKKEIFDQRTILKINTHK